MPTFNNLQYLKLCVESLKKNSSFNNELIIHVNEGTDGSFEYVKQNQIDHTYSKVNIGLCSAVNIAAKKATTKYILYTHDDMYFCPGWDKVLKDELEKLDNNLFYLSASMIEKNSGHIKFDCGNDFNDFDEKKLLDNQKELKSKDFQGSHWAPHLIHKEIWDKVGGFSEEFYPGTGSDPDLNMKLWKTGVRIFKGINDFKVYHFGSVVTRKYKDNPNLTTETGSRGGKIFLLKWGISIKFFKKFIMQSDTKYLGALSNPKKNVNYLVNIIINKIYYFYVKYIYNYNNKHELINK